MSSTYMRAWLNERHCSVFFECMEMGHYEIYLKFNGPRTELLKQRSRSGEGRDLHIPLSLQSGGGDIKYFSEASLELFEIWVS